MVRKRILFTLAAIGVSVLVLGTVLISQETYSIYGSIWKTHGGHDGDMYAHYLGPGPSQRDSVLAAWVPESSTWYYSIDDLSPGIYKVWAKYEDQFEICQTPMKDVEIEDADVHHDIKVESEDCEDKP